MAKASMAQASQSSVLYDWDFLNSMSMGWGVPHADIDQWTLSCRRMIFAPYPGLGRNTLTSLACSFNDTIIRFGVFLTCKFCALVMNMSKNHQIQSLHCT